MSCQVPIAVLLVLALPALAAAPAQAAEDPQAFLDLFHDMEVGRLEYETSCDGGAFEVDAQAGSFRFDEQAPGPALPLPGPGPLVQGCGTASLRLPVPEHAERLHVRFGADRAVQAPPGTPVAFVQEVALLGADGGQLAAERLFPAAAPASGSAPFDIAFQVPAGHGDVFVVWRFADEGFGDHAATVQAPAVEFQGIPAAHVEAILVEDRQGRLATRDLSLRVEVPADEVYTAQLRVRVDAGMAFGRLEAPDGSLVTEAVSPRPGVALHDHDAPVEEQADGIRQLTVPRAVVERLGEGGYTLAFRGVDEVPRSAVLMGLAWLLLLVPVPFAMRAFFQVRAFQREAFGAFARSARNLRLAVLAVLAYYVAVIVSAALSGRLDLMATWPLPLEGVLLYVQVAVAVVAFVVLWLVARELHGITRPKQTPHAAARPD